MTFSPLSVGKVIAIVVLVLAVVFLAIHQISTIEGGLLALLSIAILLL
jgi:hypothetical protein